MRTQVELPNDVAVELAGSQDAVLQALEAHLECKVFLRGNLLTFDGEESETNAGERVVRELSDLISRGHQIGPGRSRRSRVLWTRMSRPPECSRTSSGDTVDCGWPRRRSTRSVTWTP